MHKPYQYDEEYGNIELSFDYLVKQFNRYAINMQNIKMLDIGTNIGSLPYMLHSRYSINVYGVDIDENQINKGKDKYKDIANKLSVIGNNLKEFKDDSYEVITMFDVIEHIPDVNNYLKDAYRLLKRGGLLVFQTPNARINPIYEMIQSKSLTRWKEYHCSLQTPKQLRNILFLAGFEDIIIEKYRIDSAHNREKIRRYFGPFDGMILTIFQLMPLALFPNLWGVARKPF